MTLWQSDEPCDLCEDSGLIEVDVSGLATPVPVLAHADCPACSGKPDVAGQRVFDARNERVLR